MANQIILYLGSFLLIFWGTAHLFPTSSVVKGFGDISIDNKRIITMEWIIEGIALIFIGAIVASVTTIDFSNSISKTIYWLSCIVLLVLSAISLLTGSKVKYLPFKLCPIIFATSAILIFIGSVI